MALNNEERKDTLQYNLKEVVVNESAPITPIQTLNKGRVHWNLDEINDLPQILGQADPIRYLQTLPGVQTNNEYDSGVHIYGCDNSHNYISIEDVPLYNANHLLGLFSIFNTSHFPDFTINKSAISADFPNRLGGKINMNLPDEVIDSINGDISLGLISSQGTLQLPIGKKNMITLSARACYVNLLYSGVLKIDDAQFKYSFGDLNATWLHKPNKNNTFTLSFFKSEDNASVQEQNYLANIGLKWHNTMILAKWEHTFCNNAIMQHSIYYTDYKNNFNLTQESIGFDLPSKITDIAYHGLFKQRSFSIGFDAIRHKIEPQSPNFTQILTSTNTVFEKLNTHEFSLSVDKTFALPHDMALNTGLRSSAYLDQNNETHMAIDPSISLSMYRNKWDFSTTLSSRHQFIYQTGFSAVGLPTEFWMTSDSKHKPQKSLNAIATFGYKIFPNCRISTELYYKYLKDIIEYNGSLLDFIQTQYNLDNHLYQGNGCNYGINLMCMASLGKVSGWIGYNWGRALRTFHDKNLNGEYPANHERISEFNFVGTYDINTHWKIGATYVFASGTPFTSPLYSYLFSGNLITQYGEHNARRLSPYSRLDISINYKFKTKHIKDSGINLSIYNTLATRNEIFWRWKVKDGKEFQYKPSSFIGGIMPSLSYYIKF